MIINLQVLIWMSDYPKILYWVLVYLLLYYFVICFAIQEVNDSTALKLNDIYKVIYYGNK